MQSLGSVSARVLVLRSGAFVFVKSDGLVYQEVSLPLENVIALTQLDDSRIAVATKDSPVVNLVSLTPFQIIESIKADNSNVLFLAGNAQFLVSVSAKRLRFWDVPGHVLTATFPLSSQEVVAVAMASSPSTLCFVAERAALYSLAPEAVRSEIASFPGHDQVRDLAVAADERLVALLSGNKVVELEISSREISASYTPEFRAAGLCSAGVLDTASQKIAVWPFQWLRACAAEDVMLLASLATKIPRPIANSEFRRSLRACEDPLQFAAHLVQKRKLAGISGTLAKVTEKSVRTGNQRHAVLHAAVSEHDHLFRERAALLAAVSNLDGKLDLLSGQSGVRKSRPAAPLEKIPTEETVSTDEDVGDLSADDL